MRLENCSQHTTDCAKRKRDHFTHCVNCSTERTLIVGSVFGSRRFSFDGNGTSSAVVVGDFLDYSSMGGAPDGDICRENQSNSIRERMIVASSLLLRRIS